MSTEARCTATTKAGSRCRIEWSLRDDPNKGFLCRAHDPARREEFLATSKLGGFARIREAKPPDPSKLPTEGPPRSANDCMKWLSWTTWAAATGELSKASASAITSTIRALLSAIETADLEEQVRDLEKQLKQLKRLAAAGSG